MQGVQWLQDTVEFIFVYDRMMPTRVHPNWMCWRVGNFVCVSTEPATASPTKSAIAPRGSHREPSRPVSLKA